MPFILGVVVLILLLWAANGFSKADPKLAARVLRYIGGGATLLFAAFLLVRGEIGIALSVGAVGLGLLGWIAWPASFTGRTQKRPGQVSRVRSAFLEMELDHDSGAMRGRIIAGHYEGTPLEALDVPTLIGLLGAFDSDSRDLLAAYLDRREPSWRENAQGDAAAGGNSARSAPSGKMTEEEAYQILGVEPGASTQDITRAHRSLMKKLHPDQGGSTYLAARVNEAKDILLRRHR